MMNLDDFAKLALERYISAVDEHNMLVSKVKSVESREKFQENFLETDAALAEFNEKIERLRSALESLLGQRLVAATPLIEPAYQAALSGVGVDPEVLKDIKRKVSAGAKYLVSMYGEDILKDTPKPEAMRVSSGSSDGPKAQRLRGFDIYIDGELAAKPNAKGEMVSNFTHGANALKVETTELRRAFFAAAGSEDYKADDFPTVITFDFQGKNIRVVKDDANDDSNDDASE